MAEHEPTIAELTAKVVALEESVTLRAEAQRALDAERDKRYEQRFLTQEANVTTAIAAVEKSNAAAFAGSEKAIVKAELAQNGVNERGNEFRQTVADITSKNVTRVELEAIIKALGESIQRIVEDIRQLRDAQNLGAGAKGQVQESHAQTQEARVNRDWTADFGLRLIGLVIVALEAYRIFAGK